MSKVIKHPIEGMKSSRIEHNTYPGKESIKELQGVIQKLLIEDSEGNPTIANDIAVDWEEVVGEAVVPDQVLRITLGGSTYELNVKKIV
jgi:hypothetical protein